MKLHGVSLFKATMFKHGAAAGGIMLLVFSLVGISGAAFDGKKGRRGGVEESDIKNFGKVNNHIYRGGQPEAKEYIDLAAMGIKTVIDLREDPERYARGSAEGAGLRYINLPLNSKRPPTEAESDRFLQLVNDDRNWPVFVHCAAGRHRTGALLAVYRMEMDGWDARRAYGEMKDYKFYSKFGHGDMKEFVFDYYGKMMARRAALLTPVIRARLATGEGQNN